jgi:hypothetical protein
MWFIIELLGLGRPHYVESYSNTNASPRTTLSNGAAKVFGSEQEANSWARAYLPGFNYKVVLLLNP